MADVENEKVRIYGQDGPKKGMSPFLWLIPLLLILGLIGWLFTRHRSDQAMAGNGAPATDMTKPDSAPGQPAGAWTAQRITEELTSKGQVTFYENAIHFETAKSDILPDSAAVTGEVVSVLQAHPEWKMRVEGYTDNAGDAASNQRLSEERAASVVTYLAEHGVDRSRLDSKGSGQDHPVADNNSDTGRAQNRRVVLVKE